MKKSLVTVILPTFKRNYDRLLNRAIESVLSQSYRSFELLIYDNGSYDGTTDTVNHYAKQDSRIQVIRSEKNYGLPAYSTLSSLKRGKGEYFAFIFDDCEWKQSKLEKLVSFLDSQAPNVAMVYGKAEIDFGTRKSHIGAKFDPKALSDGNNFIPNSCVLIKKEALLSIGWYDTSIVLRRLCDLDLWQRIAKKYDITFFPETLAIENGAKLPDSLGNTSSLFPDLISEYKNFRDSKAADLNEFFNSAIDYSELLNILPLPQKKELLLLLSEHYLNICDFTALAGVGERYAENNFETHDLAISNLLHSKEYPTSMLPIYFKMSEQYNTIRDLSNRIFDMQKYIDSQQALINTLNSSQKPKRKFISTINNILKAPRR